MEPLQTLGELSEHVQIACDGEDVVEIGIFDIGDAATAHTAIRAASTVDTRRLKVWDCTVTDDLLLGFRHSAVEELSLWRGEIRGPGLAALATCVGLRELCLGDNRLDQSGHLRHLADLPSLERLDVSLSWCSDPGIEAISKSRSLRGLVAYHSEVGDSGLLALGREGRLTRINIGKCPRVTNVGVAALVGCQNLETLLVSQNPAIDDMVVDSLCSFRRLELLFVRGTSISKDGLDLLQQCLPATEFDEEVPDYLKQFVSEPVRRPLPQ